MSRHLALACLILALARACPSGQAQEVPSQEPPQAVTEQPRAPVQGAPVYLFLGTPADLGGLLTRVANPDFVIVEWERYRALLDRDAVVSKSVEQSTLPQAIQIGGVLGETQADLEITFTFVIDNAGPVVAPLRLDGAILTEVTEAGRPLAVAARPGSGWTVELRGVGTHSVRVKLRAPVRGVGDDRRLELALAESSSTRIELVAPSGVASARLGTGEPVTIVPSDKDQPPMLAGLLPPRPRLDLEWSNPRSQANAGQTVLTTTGEIAIDLEMGIAQIAATYQVRAVRGSLNELGIDIEPILEHVEIAVDEQPVDVESVRRDPEVAGRVWIPLSLTAQRPVELTIKGRRTLPRGDSSNWSFRGFPIVGSTFQTALVAVSSVDGLSVSGRAERALRPIDPRTELTPSLRTRPSVILGYRALEQPFVLELSVDRASAWLAGRSRSSVWVDQGAIQLDTWIDFQGSKSRMDRVELEIPSRFSLAEIGPPEIVDGADMLPSEPEVSATRRVVVRLSALAASSGRFSIQLNGTLPLADQPVNRIPLIRPAKAAGWSGIVALIESRDVTLEPLPSEDISTVSGVAPNSWTWPVDRPDLRAPRISWLRHGAGQAVLEFRLETKERTVAARSTASLTLDRRRIDLRQEFEILLEHGLMESLDLQVPPGLGEDWEILGLDVVRRVALTPSRQGVSRVRLILSRPIEGKTSLRLRGNQTLSRPLVAQPAQNLELPLFQFEGLPEVSRIVELATAPEIALQPLGDEWQPVAPAVDQLPRSGFPIRWRSSQTGESLRPLRIEASAAPLADLPSLVISRLVVRSTVASEGLVRVDCTLDLTRHNGLLVLSLPRRAEWTGAAADELPIEEIETVDEGSTYRLLLDSSKSSTRVRLQYVVPRSSGSSGWWGPRFATGSVVERSFWEVTLPWNLALLGVPLGWEDENAWQWDRYLWRRRPRTALATALVSNSSTVAPSSTPASSDAIYLFSRIGTPREESAWIVSRAWLLAICSGGTLVAVGVWLFASVGFRRALAATAALALLWAAATQHPSLLIQVLQSSLVGLGLGLLAISLHRRQLGSNGYPHAAPASSGTLSGNRPAEPPPSSEKPSLVVPEIGPDDSTVIRRRTASTVSRNVGPAPRDPSSIRHEGVEQ